VQALTPRVERLDFRDIAGFGGDDHLAAFRCFERSACALVKGRSEGRTARPPTAALLAAGRSALGASVANADGARRFFETWFRPFRVLPGPSDAGFLTGYYEPCVRASLTETDGFRWPLLGRPSDLVSFAPGDTPPGFPESITGARRLSDGSLVPYDDRTTIERQRRGPLAWVRDAVEAFLIQVQGSAQLEFPDGKPTRLAYDGRNGLPYASIGRILIETGEIAERAMSLETLKAWLREAGLGEGQRGLELMRQNRSFVFFRLVEDFDPALGPVAGESVPLTPLRSIAVDRTLWSYGLPFWIEAHLPWTDERRCLFRRLMIAQDTGSAIVGAARADIFFGSGDAAGKRAGAIRHPGVLTVFLPLGDDP
jgi:membrane-bound lytic murein transglycosylase A